jgi:ComF family protein
MEDFFLKSKNFLLDLLFPKYCLGCGSEGSYLCEDCLSTIDILEYQFCPGCQKRLVDGKVCSTCKKSIKINGLYFAAPYQNKLVKKMITQFKYEPFVKELKESLAYLIITHLELCDKKESDFSEFYLIPVPLEIKRLKWRGFNQSEEIGKELAKSLKTPLVSDVLCKIKETLPQMELSVEKRKENIKGAFLVKNKEKIAGRKILLVDDVYTTGSTMNECARALKESGAKEIWGVAVARE